MSEETCPVCRQGRLVRMRKKGNVEVKEFSCGHRRFAITLKEVVKITDELKLKAKGPRGKRGKPIREIKSRVTDSFERRAIVKRACEKSKTSVIMVDWNKSKGITHLHCKRCGNEWRDSDAEDLSMKFDVKPTQSDVLHIVCKKCGREVMSG